MADTTILCEGKTKIIYDLGDGLVRLTSKDDITAGDGARHDMLAGKAVISTETTTNVFCFLKRFERLPIAFIERDSPTSFTARRCRMLPWEVVVRGEAHGSYLKRYPKVAWGHRFTRPIAEFYLKTKDRTWLQHNNLPCDDPLARIDPKGFVDLYLPNEPKEIGHYFLRLQSREVHTVAEDAQFFELMGTLAVITFVLLRLGWEQLGYNLVDFKIEFGITDTGSLMIADVIDNDSWRLLHDGNYLDKQVYRDGGQISDVLKNYRHVAALTSKFASLPLVGTAA